MRRLLYVCATLALGAATAHAQAIPVDSSISAYQKASGVSGNINSVGSDTMNNLMTLWARELPQDVPERQDPDRGQGLLDGAARADRRHVAVRADVARR